MRVVQDSKIVYKSGIYKIINTINNRIYIGSAFNLNGRKSEHFSTLRKNKHRNSKLQNSYNKYGDENFLFEIIERCDKSILLEREQYYIDTLKPFFNICKIAGNTAGRKVSDSAKLKMSIAKKGIPHDPDVVRNRSAKLKGRVYSEESINNMRSGIKNMSEDAKLERIKKLVIRANNRSRESLENIATGRCKPVNQLDMDGVLIKKWSSGQEAGRVLKINKSAISACCRRIPEYKSASGYKWEFAKK